MSFIFIISRFLSRISQKNLFSIKMQQGSNLLKGFDWHRNQIVLQNKMCQLHRFPCLNPRIARMITVPLFSLTFPFDSRNISSYYTIRFTAVGKKVFRYDEYSPLFGHSACRILYVCVNDGRLCSEPRIGGSHRGFQCAGGPADCGEAGRSGHGKALCRKACKKAAGRPWELQLVLPESSKNLQSRRCSYI